MPAPRIALIHATPLAIDPIVSAFKRLWPEARITNLLEDSLAPDLAADGRLTDTMTERFLTLTRYVHGCGSDAILFTCSAFGPAIEAAAKIVPVPVLKPNEAMLEEAMAAGDRIGLLATFGPTVPGLTAELEALAKAAGRTLQLKSKCIPEANTALSNGDQLTHDTLVSAAATPLMPCDALVLGQFSMATAARFIQPPAGCQVLTSPDSAIRKLRKTLGA
jgi:Asp/Glu/hydantoin racemase